MAPFMSFIMHKTARRENVTKGEENRGEGIWKVAAISNEEKWERKSWKLWRIEIEAPEKGGGREKILKKIKDKFLKLKKRKWNVKEEK